MSDADRLAAADSALLTAASSNADNWDDATWAAWWRDARRAQNACKGRVTQLEAENAELRTKLATAERQLHQLDAAIDDAYAIPGRTVTR